MLSCLVARHPVLWTILSPRDISLSSQVSAVHAAWRTKKSSRSFINDRRRRNAGGGCRAYSSSPEASNDFDKTTKASSSRQDVLALLHRISAFLPRALSASIPSHGGGIQSSQLWSELLSEAGVDLSSSSSSSPDARQGVLVVVCGADQWAGSQQLVTALLENPFTSDEAYSDILRNRWKNQSTYLTIEHGPSTSLVNGTLAIPSSWLQQHPFPIQITEVPSFSLQPTLPKTLLKGDVLILLCNPLTTPISTLISNAAHLLQRRNTILLLITPGSSSEYALEHVTKQLTSAGCNPGKILAVDPIRASEAVSALKSDPSSPSAIQRYQNDFSGSRISLLGDALAGMLGSKDSGRVSLLLLLLLEIRTRTALMQMRSALCASAESVTHARLAIERVLRGASELESQVKEVRVRTTGREDVLAESGVDDAVLRSLRDIKTVLGSLTLSKMIWRVDEIDTIVGSALEKHWCRELESQLILQTGRLASTQASLTSSTFAVLAKLASPVSFPAFHSPVLDNHLRQLTHSPSYTVNTDALTGPIQTRRLQITRHTTVRLHRDAQNAVLGTFGGMLGGAGIGWWLAFGESVLGFGGAGGAGSEAGTALGAGALVAVASVRWAVGKWERAKRRWVDDVDRVGEGLKRDIKIALQESIEKKVAVVPIAACEGLREIAAKQEEEVDVIRSEIVSMQMDLEALETGRLVPHSPE